jgi:hypothetical protein
MLESLLSYQQVYLPKRVEVKPTKILNFVRTKTKTHTFAPPPATTGPRYFSFSQRPRNILKYTSVLNFIGSLLQGCQVRVSAPWNTNSTVGSGFLLLGTPTFLLSCLHTELIVPDNFHFYVYIIALKQE